MSVREAVQKLERLGQFSTYDHDNSASKERVPEYKTLLASIAPRVTNEEARILCRLLNEDDFYGLAWTTLHLIETAPGWPDKEAIEQTTPEWREIFEQRCRNAES